MSGPAQKTVTTLDVITGPDTTGPVGTVRLSRSSAGLQVSVDGAAPAAISGGGVASISSANALITVDSTDPTAPILTAAAQFGADTTISQVNGSAIAKTTWEGISAYTTNTNGAEVTNYTIKVLQAGAQVSGQVITGTGTTFPAGVYDGTAGHTKCSVALTDPGNGFSYGIVAGRISFFAAGIEIAELYLNHFNLIGFSSFLLGSTGIIANNITNTNSQNNLQLMATSADVVFGPDGVTADAATSGFMQIPTCAGVPTGNITNSLTTGKAGLILGNTGATKHLYAFFGGSWTAIT